MKKNLLFTICMCLLIAVSTGFAADDHDTIIAYGTTSSLEGNNGNLGIESITTIFQTYVDENWDKSWLISNDNGNPTAGFTFNPDGTTCIEFNDPNNWEWTYAILASNSNTAEWYLFRNDHVDAGSTLTFLWADEGHNSVMGDNYLITPVYGADLDYPIYEYDASNPYGIIDEPAYVATGEASNPFTQLDYTLWIVYDPRDPRDTDLVPEPGSILLLGTGIIGLGFAAKRKFGKK